MDKIMLIQKEMGSDFLVNDGIRKQRFNSVEIEKLISDYVFVLRISTTTDFFTISLDKKERLLNVLIRPYVGESCMPNLTEEEMLSFTLPGWLDVDGYFYLNENQKAYVIFRKMDRKEGPVFYY